MFREFSTPARGNPHEVLHRHAVHSAETNKEGQAIYARSCASCHGKPAETKAPPLDTLKRMGPRAISYR
jgi:mono/diheme cytochrome c family protein